MLLDPGIEELTLFLFEPLLQTIKIKPLRRDRSPLPPVILVLNEKKIVLPHRNWCIVETHKRVHKRKEDVLVEIVICWRVTDANVGIYISAIQSLSKREERELSTYPNRTRSEKTRQHSEAWNQWVPPLSSTTKSDRNRRLCLRKGSTGNTTMPFQQLNTWSKTNNRRWRQVGEIEGKHTGTGCIFLTRDWLRSSLKYGKRSDCNRWPCRSRVANVS